MATRAIDLLIAYRVIKMLVTPFNKQPAYQYVIIDYKGKVLKKFLSLKTTTEKNTIQYFEICIQSEKISK